MITDMYAKNFVARRLRPLAEKARAFNLVLTDVIDAWDTQNLVTLMPNDPNEILEDLMAGEGVLSLSGADVNAMIEALRQAKDFLNQPEIRTIVQRFCVRPTEVS